MAIDPEAQARRREVGRTLLSLTDTMANTLWLFRRSKEDAATLAELRVACDEALGAMRDALEALTRFRRTLDERLSRPSHASEQPS